VLWAISDVREAVTRCLPALRNWARGGARGPSARQTSNGSPCRRKERQLLAGPFHESMLTLSPLCSVNVVVSTLQPVQPEKA
jgi:hypothetical protein